MSEALAAAVGFALSPFPFSVSSVPNYILPYFLKVVNRKMNSIWPLRAQVMTKQSGRVR